MITSTLIFVRDLPLVHMKYLFRNMFYIFSEVFTWNYTMLPVRKGLMDLSGHVFNRHTNHVSSSKRVTFD